MPYRAFVITLLVILSLPVLAVSSEPPKAPVAPGRPVQFIDVSTLIFDQAEIEEQFKCFDATVRRFVTPDFKYKPYRLRGNFVIAEWTKGSELGSNLGFPASGTPSTDLHKIHIDTIVVPPPPRDGVEIEVTNNPSRAKGAFIGVTFVSCDPDVWCISWSYRNVNGRQAVTGSDWHIYFFRWDPAIAKRMVPYRPLENPRERISLPLRGYSVSASPVNIRREVSLMKDFFRHIRSATAMREAYLADLEQLEAGVLEELREHRAKKYVSNEAVSNEPPGGYNVPLTEDEEAVELAKANKYFATQRKLMEDHYETLYATFRKSFPVENLWPELIENR